MQINLEKTFDTIEWSFVEATMHTTGFNHKMSKVSHRLYNNSIVTCILDAEITYPRILFYLVREDCSISASYAIATHPWALHMIVF